MAEPLVVKLGGVLAGMPGALDDVACALPALARTRLVIVVPGGGPFADQVRSVQRDLGASDDAAHWMAILGMDQYALLLADRMPFARLVDDVDALRGATAGEVLIFAPSRWMRAADPLPHTWDATSDSIAAVLAGVACAAELLLVKAVPGTPERLADAHFASACPPGVAARCVTPPELLALAGSSEPPRPARAPASR